MKITVVKPVGYCAGIRNAVNIAMKARQDYPNKRVIVIGLLAHNSAVIDELTKNGIETFYDPTYPMDRLVSAAPYGSVIIFPCYGHDEKLQVIANRRGLIVYDAICPKIKYNFSRIKAEINAGHQVIFIGQHRHDETNAVLSISKEVLLYDLQQKFDYLDVRDYSPFVTSQSTLNVLNLTNIHKDIYSCIPNARISDEVCNSTRIRQQAIQDLPDTVDLIVIVGEEMSTSTTRLFELTKMYHPNTLCIMISNESEIENSLFIDKKHVAIASGGETPLKTVEAVVNHIKNIRTR